MREIKYRGLRTDGKGWVYGYFSKDHEDGKCYIEDIDFHHQPKEEIHPETVGKFMGLKDKNGKEIYEGDVVRHRYSKEQGFNTIVFCQERMGWALDNMSYEDWAQDVWHNTNKLEVIGNIHENQQP